MYFASCGFELCLNLASDTVLFLLPVDASVNELRTCQYYFKLTLSFKLNLQVGHTALAAQ
jgi:hypothetical protein